MLLSCSRPLVVLSVVPDLPSRPSQNSEVVLGIEPSSQEDDESVRILSTNRYTRQPDMTVSCLCPD